MPLQVPWPGYSYGPDLLLWTECLCPLRIRMLKLLPSVGWYLEVGPLRSDQG